MTAWIVKRQDIVHTTYRFGEGAADVAFPCFLHAQVLQKTPQQGQGLGSDSDNDGVRGPRSGHHRQVRNKKEAKKLAAMS